MTLTGQYESNEMSETNMCPDNHLILVVIKFVSDFDRSVVFFEYYGFLHQ
jgi:hypothetical protein